MAIKARQLECAKSVELIFPDGSTRRKPKLMLVVTRLRIGRIRLSLTCNAVQGVEAGTRIKFPYVTMKLICAGFGDQIDHSAARTAIFGRC